MGVNFRGGMTTGQAAWAQRDGRRRGAAAGRRGGATPGGSDGGAAAGPPANRYSPIASIERRHVAIELQNDALGGSGANSQFMWR